MESICMRYKIYHELERYIEQPICHNRAICIMSNVLWIHSLMNDAATSRGLHVSADYAVYLYVFMNGYLEI